MSRSARTSRTTGSHAPTRTIASPDDITNSAAGRLAALKASNKLAGSIHHDRTDEFPDSRATKRRKLEIRGPRQQTLDSFFSNNPPKPPISIALSAPNGHIIETINGVRRDLPVNATEILQDSTIATTVSAEKATKRLKTVQGQKQEEKRTLRSQDDGPRLKSELATYFNNYEDIIFDAPREVELLNIDTTLYIVDDTPAKVAKGVTTTPAKSVKNTPQRAVNGSPSLPRASASQAQHTPELDLSPIMRTLPDTLVDPLTDAAFMVSHRRAERKEKQMRNIERAHAMHEKAQLERLLDGLLGHDWLRVLGITGVTESEAKKFETKRDYFIAEVRYLVDKFNQWREDEKRQKQEREDKLAAEREQAEEADDSTEASSNGPGSSDLNVSASKQLQQEAARSLAATRARKKEQRRSIATPPPVPYRPPSPIMSFYSSRHLRESALKKARNSRNVTAFGLPLPDFDEREFALPDDYVTANVLSSSARERRRKNRELVANAAAKPP